MSDWLRFQKRNPAPAPDIAAALYTLLSRRSVRQTPQQLNELSVASWEMACQHALDALRVNSGGAWSPEDFTQTGPHPKAFMVLDSPVLQQFQSCIGLCSPEDTCDSLATATQVQPEQLSQIMGDESPPHLLAKKNYWQQVQQNLASALE